MVEETEVVQTVTLTSDILFAVVMLFIGITIETVIEIGKRRLRAHHWKITEVIVRSFQGQAFLICVLLAALQMVRNTLQSPGVINVLSNFVTAIVIFSLTFAMVRLVTNLLIMSVANLGITSVSLINNIIRVTSFLFMFGVALQLLGFQIGPWLTIVAGSSVGLSLALQRPLSDLFSGMLLLASNRIRPGNYIQLSSGEEGFVTDIQWHTTMIRQLSNNMIIVPNSVMVSANVINFDEPAQELSILINLGVSYDSDLRHVEQITLDVAHEVMREVSGGVEGANCMVRYHTFGDFSIDFTVILRGQQFTDQFVVRHEFIQRLHERYRQEGIVIPFPIRTIEMGSSVELQSSPSRSIPPPLQDFPPSPPTKPPPS